MSRDEERVTDAIDERTALVAVSHAALAGAPVAKMRGKA